MDKPVSPVILTIDDDDGVRQSIAAYLADSGFTMLEAADGDQGLAMFDEHRPDIVLTDLRMPNVDGLTVLRQIMRKVPEQPVLVISGAGAMSDAVEAIRLGASDYFIKPIADLEVLEHRIARCLEQARLSRENQRYRLALEEKNRQLSVNLKLLEQDQQAGRLIQQKLLPKTPLNVSDYTLSHKIIPSLYLSGDFVEYIVIDDRWIAFFIADVSGHGASSAFLTTLVKNFASRQYSYYQRGQHRAILEPELFLTKLNRSMLNSGFDKHLTMIFGVIDIEQNTLTYSVAGHLPLPVLVEPGAVAQYLPGRGMPIALFENPTFSTQSIDLPKQFTLSLFSDGILEILPPKNLADKETHLLSLLSPAPKDITALEKVFCLDDIADAPDDIAVLMITKG